MDTQLETKDYSVNIDNMNQKQWSAVLENFADASIYQTWEYGAVRWGEKNLSHMVVKKGGEIISAAQLRIVTIPFLGMGMAYIFYGPMWKVNGTSENIANFQLGLRALIDEYALKRGLFLRLRPWGFCEEDNEMKSSLISNGFKTTRGIYREIRRTIMVDLRPSAEEMRKGLKKKWRQTLQRAERENLEILESYNGDFFPYFLALFFETLKVKKFKPGSDVNEFARIQERLSGRQLCVRLRVFRYRRYRNRASERDRRGRKACSGVLPPAMG